jgi:hypothetical protein
VIDRLDEDWVEDKLRYLLIRALIETIREFGKVRNAKIIIALRYDLLDRVVRLTRDAGFQEEKYETLYLPIEWTKESLVGLLDTRIDRLVKSRYTVATVTHKDLLPAQINKQAGIDYILQRTLMRPRDIILFFNLCVAQAKDNPKITVQMVRQAEGEYSRLRLRSLADEWQSDYPNLFGFVSLLKGRPSQFALDAITDDDCLEVCIHLHDAKDGKEDELSLAADGLVRGTTNNFDGFKRTAMATFYKVGLVGLKLEHHEGISWSISSRRSISVSEVRSGTRVAIHPCFWRTLGVQDVVNGGG